MMKPMAVVCLLLFTLFPLLQCVEYPFCREQSGMRFEWNIFLENDTIVGRVYFMPLSGSVKNGFTGFGFASNTVNEMNGASIVVSYSPSTNPRDEPSLYQFYEYYSPITGSVTPLDSIFYNSLNISLLNENGLVISFERNLSKPIDAPSNYFSFSDTSEQGVLLAMKTDGIPNDPMSLGYHNAGTAKILVNFLQPIINSTCSNILPKITVSSSYSSHPVSSTTKSNTDIKSVSITRFSTSCILLFVVFYVIYFL